MMKYSNGLTPEIHAGLHGRGLGWAATSSEYVNPGNKHSMPVILMTRVGDGDADCPRWFTLDAVEQWACELLVLARAMREGE